MWPPKITPCQCDQAGWCERHQTQKSSAWFLICRTNQFEFDAWERGEGPKIGGAASTPTVTQRIRCQHRSDEAVGSVDCQCCGGAVVAVPIYQCERFRQCLEHPCRAASSNLVELPICQTCPQFSPKA